MKHRNLTSRLKALFEVFDTGNWNPSVFSSRKQCQGVISRVSTYFQRKQKTSKIYFVSKTVSIGFSGRRLWIRVLLNHRLLWGVSCDHFLLPGSKKNIKIQLFTITTAYGFFNAGSSNVDSSQSETRVVKPIRQPFIFWSESWSSSTESCFPEAFRSECLEVNSFRSSSSKCWALACTSAFKVKISRS